MPSLSVTFSVPIAEVGQLPLENGRPLWRIGIRIVARIAVDQLVPQVQHMRFGCHART